VLIEVDYYYYIIAHDMNYIISLKRLFLLTLISDIVDLTSNVT